ncbi:MAG: hypothetical protein WCQ54_12210 [Clostridiaceae bacterium]
MKYYYGNLIFQTLFFIFIIIICSNLIINLKKKKVQKRWWFAIIIIIPLMIYYVYDFLLIPYTDLEYAVKGNPKTVEGKVEKVYLSGGTNTFILDGKEFRRNPFNFKPKVGEKYRLTYLPNSGYVVYYELIGN